MGPSIGLSSQLGASAQLCRRCLQFQVATVAKSQRRWVGQKYLAKQDEAQKRWDERAEKIQAGELRNLWDIFEERGYIKDLAGQRDHIRELMRRKRIGAYVGVDPTAQSLHVGHLLPMMPLFWMYLHGYQAISLIGGATAKIGDPTDRLKSRDAIPPSTMTMNMTKIHYQLKKIWVNVEAQGRKYGYQKEWAWKRGLVNNNAWWNSTPLLEVLKRLGASIRIGPMLSRDTVKRKLTEGDGMSFAEFSYPLMQGWDWWHMFRSRGIQMQIGGSDQYGNIVTGIDTVKICRANEPNPADKLPETEWDDPVGFTVPLLTDSSGVKFGKSAGNAVWLDQWLTNTFDLYGYFVRRPDADVEKLLKLFTFLPLEDIETKVAEHNADPSKRVAQHLLAYEVVSLVHGEAAAKDAQEQHRSMYGGKGTVAAAARSSEYDAVEGHPTTLNNAPRVDMQLPQSLIMGKSIGRILYAAGLASSVSDGHRLAQQKGAHIGGSPGQKPNVNKGMLIGQLDFTPIGLWFPEDTKRFLIDGKLLVLRKGKHNVRIIEMVSDEEWEASGKKYPGEPGTGKIRQMRDQLQALKEGTYEPNPEDPSEPMIVFPKRKNIQQLEDKIEQLSKSPKHEQ